jgi:hypothetical protein
MDTSYILYINIGASIRDVLDAINKLSSKIVALNERVNDVDRRLEAGLGALNERVDVLEKKVDGVKQELTQKIDQGNSDILISKRFTSNMFLDFVGFLLYLYHSLGHEAGLQTLSDRMETGFELEPKNREHAFECIFQLEYGSGRVILYGSAVAVSPTQALTCLHGKGRVGADVGLVSRDGARFRGVVAAEVFSALKYDVALIALQGDSLFPHFLEVSEAPVALGQALRILGFRRGLNNDVPSEFFARGHVIQVTYILICNLYHIMFH